MLPAMREVQSIFPYSVWVQENTDQKNSECGHFLVGSVTILYVRGSQFKTILWSLEIVIHNKSRTRQRQSWNLDRSWSTST